MAQFTIPTQWWAALTPQIGLVVLGVMVLALDVARTRMDRRLLGWVTAAGLLLALAASVLWAQPQAQGELVWGGMLRHDWLAFVFQLVFLLSAAITALFAMDAEEINRRGEFYLLLLAATFGMTLMAAASDLIMVFLAIETTSIPLYALAGFMVKDNKSTEAGFKYLLFGAMTSAVLLYAFSLLFGFAGTTQIYQLAQQYASGNVPLAALVGVALLALVGFGFKISAAPLHFWAPDAYEGAPTPIAGFLSTASKAAGFAVLMRVFLAAFPQTQPEWRIILAVVAAVSMIVGNFLAISQKNIKRLLAYSSIGHAGYILIGVAAATPLGFTATVFYLIAYLVTNLAAFGVVTIVGRSAGSDDLTAYAGLSRRNPTLALVLMTAVLSLAGIPVFGGFAAKVFVFTAAIDAGMVWLAVLGIVNSMVGLYYYLNILKVMYLYRSEDESRPVSVSWPWKAALVVCVAGIILLGTLFTPWYNWAVQAAGALF